MKKENRLTKKRSVFMMMAAMFSLLWFDGAVYEISAFSEDTYPLFERNGPNMLVVTRYNARDYRSIKVRNALPNENETISDGFKVDENGILKNVKSEVKIRALERYDAGIIPGSAGINSLENQMDSGTVLPAPGIAWDQPIGSRNNLIISFSLGFSSPVYHQPNLEPDRFLTPAFNEPEQKYDTESAGILDKIISSFPFMGVMVKYKF